MQEAHLPRCVNRFILNGYEVENNLASRQSMNSLPFVFLMVDLTLKKGKMKLIILESLDVKVDLILNKI